MGFQSIRFHGFRNLIDGEIELGAHDIYLIGENGQGKTNIIEALYLLSYGASFRTHYDKELITWGRKEMALFGSFDMPEEPMGNTVVALKNGIKTIHLHGKKVTDRKVLLRRIPTIVFAHGDFLLSGGPPEKRRWFMDQTLSLHDPFYVDQLRRYKKLLKERNYLLKEHRLSLLDHYSEQLASAGLEIAERRWMLTQEFGEMFSSLFHEVSGLDAPVTISYRPSWGQSLTCRDVVTKLQERLDADLAAGTTFTGPHRDRFVFTVEGRDFGRSASTGQQRLLSLALKAAQAKFFFEKTGQRPILLLDDVLLELDPDRRQRFRRHLPDAEQVFYTFLPGEEAGRIGDDSRTYEVKSGSFHER